jgi:hypothetical protein
VSIISIPSKDQHTPVIEVTIKSIYGRDTIYPVCPRSKLFASLKGQKTLTPYDISIIKQLGYTVLVVHPETTL